MPVSPITLEQIHEARNALGMEYANTRVISSPTLSRSLNAPVFLKLENQQVIGSFKIRGAVNAIKRLNEAQRKKGVICVSSGNHGRGIAYAARNEAIRSVVCMSKLVPQNKIDAIAALGAEVLIVGASQDEAQITVDQIVAASGMNFLSPFDHPNIIAGQGTIGLEIHEQVKDLAMVLVPVSGGGLIAGIALALKALNPKIKVVGVSMQRGAAMHASIQHGHPIEIEELPTLADALGGGIGLENKFTFDLVQKLVDDLILVNEEEIAAAIRHLYWEEKQIVEGAGSVGVAAILANKINPNGPTAALISGGNIDMELHYQIISGANVNVS